MELIQKNEETKHETYKGINLGLDILEIIENSSEEKFKKTIEKNGRFAKHLMYMSRMYLTQRSTRQKCLTQKRLDEAKKSRLTSNANQSSNAGEEAEDIAETVVDIAAVQVEGVGGGATEEEVFAEIIVIKIEDTEIGTIEEEPEVQCQVCAQTTTWEHFDRHMKDKHREESHVGDRPSPYK